MKLSRHERAVLVNQLAIRKVLEKTDDYDQAMTILSRGYEIFYSDAFSGMYEEPMDTARSAFVLNVLDMYSHIEWSKRDWPKQAEERLKDHGFATFRGFDGNTESDLVGFTQFLINDRDKFSELKAFEKLTDRFNSHFPVESTYRGMVARWKPLRDAVGPNQLTVEQVLEIVPAPKSAP